MFAYVRACVRVCVAPPSRVFIITVGDEVVFYVAEAAAKRVTRERVCSYWSTGCLSMIRSVR